MTGASSVVQLDILGSLTRTNVATPAGRCPTKAPVMPLRLRSSVSAVDQSLGLFWLLHSRASAAS